MPQSKAEIQAKLDTTGADTEVKYGLSRFPRMYFLEASGQDIKDLWHILHSHVKSTGLWPLIWHESASIKNDVPNLALLKKPLKDLLSEIGLTATAVDISDLKKRIAQRPLPRFYSFPFSDIENEATAIRADLLLKVQELHLKDSNAIGFQPGDMPSHENLARMFDMNTVNQKYLPLLMRLQNGDELVERFSATVFQTQPTAQQVKQILKSSDSINFPQWVNATQKSSTYYRPNDKSHARVHSHENNKKGANRRYENTSSKQTTILLIPTVHSWQVPAYIGFGGLEPNPETAVHVAAMKYWEEKYGAILISLIDDRADFEVSRPPGDIAQALELAHEHFIYCPDAVKQSDGTLQTLANRLKNSTYWDFWWD